MTSKQTIAIAAILTASPTARDAWDLWMKDIETHGGNLDAAGARAFAEVHGEMRSPTASMEARALLRLATALEDGLKA